MYFRKKNDIYLLEITQRLINLPSSRMVTCLGRSSTSRACPLALLMLPCCMDRTGPTIHSNPPMLYEKAL